MSNPFSIEIDEPWGFMDPAEVWEAGYTACHNDSIRGTITPNPHEDKP